MRVTTFIASAFLLAHSAAPACADDFLSHAPSEGTGRQITVGRATLTLPPGAWKEIYSSSHENFRNQSGVRDEQMETKVYNDVSGPQSNAILVYSSNKAQTMNYVYSDGCRRKTAIIIDNISTDQFSWNCMYVDHASVSDPSPAKAFWPVVYHALAKPGDTPTTLSQAVISIKGRTQFDVLTFEIYRDVRADGFTEPKSSYATSPWQRANITPDRHAAIDKLTAWAQQYRQTLVKEFRGE